ncbi:MAG: anti-sigma factor [Chitinophagaceae bacterium]
MNIKEYIASGIIETYVMGLCTPEEERELELLRDQHPELEKAIIRFELEMEKNMMQQSTLPDTATDNRILDTLHAMKKSAPVIPVTTKGSWLKPVAVAASLLLLISTGLNFYLFNKTKKTTSTGTGSLLPHADYEVLINPAITPVAMYGVGTHTICRCTMFWDKKTGKMYIMIHHLPKSSATRDYQLWATVEGKMISVGIVKDEIRGRMIELPGVPSGATSFSITLENAGGSAAPTMEEMYLEGEI